MISISDIKNIAPKVFKNSLQKKVYTVLDKLSIQFERVDTDEVITMEDCAAVNEKLNMKMVKTLFLCNRQQTEFYLFITKGDKPFRSKDFSSVLGISRVSFAPAELMETMLCTKIGAATIFSSIIDTNNKVHIVLDKAILSEKYYGCSDGVTTSYMKVQTDDIVNKLLPFTNHIATIIEV